MGEDKLDVIESEEVNTPEIKTALQAFALIFSGLSFFLSNYKKTTLLIFASIFAVALILYNNVDVVTQMYMFFVSGKK